MTALIVVTLFAVALLGVLVAGLLRSHAEILRALHDMGQDLGHRSGSESGGTSARIELRSGPIRTREGVAEPRAEAPPAVDIIGTTPEGTTKQVGVVHTDHTTLLAFLSTGCMTCRNFWDAFADSGLALPGHDTRLVIVTKSLAEESESMLRKLAPRHVPTIASSEAWDAYDVPVSPYFILVDGPSGTTLGEGAAGSWQQVASLLDQAVADAGIATTRQRRRSGQVREEHADTQLAAAGIHPGHPSLYPETVEDQSEPQGPAAGESSTESGRNPGSR
jgi:hypothetical protein